MTARIDAPSPCVDRSDSATQQSLQHELNSFNHFCAAPRAPNLSPTKARRERPGASTRQPPTWPVKPSWSRLAGFCLNL